MLDHDTLLRGEGTLPGLLRHRAKERGGQVALREKAPGPTTTATPAAPRWA
jgi:long-chain acyl-CoA synthetase